MELLLKTGASIDAVTEVREAVDAWMVPAHGLSPAAFFRAVLCSCVWYKGACVCTSTLLRGVNQGLLRQENMCQVSGSFPRTDAIF